MKEEHGKGINKQSYPILILMLIWLGLIYLPLFILSIINVLK